MVIAKAIATAAATLLMMIRDMGCIPPSLSMATDVPKPFDWV
jgi:hypothetical protein